MTEKTVLCLVFMFAGAAITGVLLWVSIVIAARRERERAREDADRVCLVLKNGLGKVALAIDGVLGRLQQMERAEQEKLVAIETRLGTVTQSLDGYRRDVAKVEGKLEQNTQMGASYISTLGQVCRQLEALSAQVTALGPPRVRDSKNG